MMFSQTAKNLLKAALSFITLVSITEQKKSFIFRMMTLSNGSEVCALDPPKKMEMLTLKHSLIQCGIRCIQQISCRSINYYSSTGQCDMYDTMPMSSRINPGCTGYMNTGIENTVTETLIGCYADRPTHDLPDASIRDMANNTLGNCRTHCYKQGYLYAGAQFGYDCFCGNTYGSYGPSTACTIYCTGDMNTYCGGFQANTVMRTGN